MRFMRFDYIASKVGFGRQWDQKNFLNGTNSLEDFSAVRDGSTQLY